MVCDGVFIGIGANLGDRANTLQRAVSILHAESKVSVVALSSVYETDPIGVVDQPKFLNAAVSLDTDLPARDLLNYLLDIEKDFGRVRKTRWGPRTLDLDILLYRDAVIDEPGLTVPHSYLHQREFVLAPLCDLAPDVTHPVLAQSLQSLFSSLPEESQVRKIENICLKV